MTKSRSQIVASALAPHLFPALFAGFLAIVVTYLIVYAPRW